MKMLVTSAANEAIDKKVFLQMALLQDAVDLTDHKHSISCHNWFIGRYGKNGCLLCEMGSKPVVDILIEDVI